MPPGPSGYPKDTAFGWVSRPNRLVLCGTRGKYASDFHVERDGVCVEHTRCVFGSSTSTLVFACGTLFCRGHCPHEPSLLLPGLALLMVVSNGHVSAMIEVFSRKLAFKRREVRLRPRRTKVVFRQFPPMSAAPMIEMLRRSRGEGNRIPGRWCDIYHRDLL